MHAHAQTLHVFALIILLGSQSILCSYFNVC